MVQTSEYKWSLLNISLSNCLLILSWFIAFISQNTEEPTNLRLAIWFLLECSRAVLCSPDASVCSMFVVTAGLVLIASKHWGLSQCVVMVYTPARPSSVQTGRWWHHQVYRQSGGDTTRYSSSQTCRVMTANISFCPPSAWRGLAITSKVSSPVSETF